MSEKSEKLLERIRSLQKRRDKLDSELADYRRRYQAYQTVLGDVVNADFGSPQFIEGSSSRSSGGQPRSVAGSVRSILFRLDDSTQFSPVDMTRWLREDYSHLHGTVEEKQVRKTLARLARIGEGDIVVVRRGNGPNPAIYRKLAGASVDEPRSACDTNNGVILDEKAKEAPMVDLPPS